MKLYYPIEVDLFRPYPLPIMDAQQNNIGRGAQVTLKANGAIIQPTNEGLTFWAKKPDGTVSYLAATLSGTNVQLDFTSQMLALPGMVQVEIRMTAGDGADKTDISTPIFNVRVNPSNIDDTAPESTNEFTALVTALAEVAELKKNGLKGDPGEAATLEIGTVTATEPGGDPAVTNSGTSQDAILNFVLPRGQQGPKGDPGAPGQEQIVFAAASAFPTTGDPAMLYVDNTVSPAIIYTWSGSAYVQASADISTVMAMLATPFSETESYTSGKYVTYNGQYWRFTADKAAGAWDASKAEATNIGAELSALNASNNIKCYPQSGSMIVISNNKLSDPFILPEMSYVRMSVQPNEEQAMRMCTKDKSDYITCFSVKNTSDSAINIGSFFPKGAMIFINHIKGTNSTLSYVPLIS